MIEHAIRHGADEPDAELVLGGDDARRVVNIRLATENRPITLEVAVDREVLVVIVGLRHAGVVGLNTHPVLHALMTVGCRDRIHKVFTICV